jgi:hypothetical protein
MQALAVFPHIAMQELWANVDVPITGGQVLKQACICVWHAAIRIATVPKPS